MTRPGPIKNTQDSFPWTLDLNPWLTHTSYDSHFAYWWMSPYDSSLAYWSPYWYYYSFMTHWLFSSLSDAHSAQLLIHYCTITHTLTHGLVLYLDTDPPVYKSALDIPKTSDLTWLFSRIPCTPLYFLTSHNTSSFLETPLTWVIPWNTKPFQKAPLSAALPSHLYHLLLPWKTGTLTSDWS